MLSGKRLLLLGFIVVLLVVIPLTVYLVRQQQKLGAGAAPQTNISFSQPSVSTSVNQTFTEDVNITTGGNQISFVKLTINFDPAKLQPTAMGATLCPAHPDYVICPSALFPNPPLQGPTVSGNSVSITLSVGSNPTAVISTTVPTKIATVNFKALSVTTTPTQISFAPADQTQVLSIASADQFNENVLAGNPQPANVTITGSANQSAPVCSSLTLANGKSTTGTAPYSVTFALTGNSPTSTITKVFMDFGNSLTSTLTSPSDSRLGTNTINLQIPQTFQNPGTFTVTATLTDSNGLTGPQSKCSMNLTVNNASAASTASPTPAQSPAAGGASTTTQTVTIGGSSPSSTVSATPAPVVTTVTATPQPALPPAGPGDKIISLGALGIISSIIGALIILFAL